MSGMPRRIASTIGLAGLVGLAACLFPSLDGLDDRDAGEDAPSAVDVAPDVAVDATDPSGAHGGTHVLRADFTGTTTPGYSNTWEWVTTSPQQSYELAVWMRGGSNVQLLVKDGNWGTNVLTQECDATPVWTQCVTPMVQSGQSTQMTLIVQDGIAPRPAALLFLDDMTFKDTSGNDVALQGGFEDAGPWNVGTPPFSIVECDGGCP